MNDDEREEESTRWWREMFVGLAAWEMRAMMCCTPGVGSAAQLKHWSATDDANDEGAFERERERASCLPACLPLPFGSEHCVRVRTPRATYTPGDMYYTC